jgi:dinuclear metal center YbgI/SA1388 family protein
MKTKKLLLKLSKKFPKRIAKGHHDYVGLMCGKIGEEVRKITLCLDFDDTIYPEVIANTPDLIITHHPFIYGLKSKVLKNDENKRNLVEKLNRFNVPVYSFHTNFDEGKDGMNDALAEKIGLTNIKQLETYPMARGGDLPYPMNIDELTAYLCKKLNVTYGHPINAGEKMIKSLAIIGGGGWYLYKNAKLEGYDCYVSGDIPHHGRRDIIVNKYNYIDLPHEIENIFLERMKKILLDIDPTLEITIVYHEKNPHTIIV